MNNSRFSLGYAVIIFFGAAGTIVLFDKLGIKESPIIIALLFTPLLVYGIASGKILELSAPGGWSAKFREAAQQNVGTTATPLTEGLNKLQAVEKEGYPKLDKTIQKLEKGKPVALILYFGKLNYYEPEMVKLYVEKLKAFDPDLAIIIVDLDSKRFICAIDANSFLQLHVRESDQLIEAIGKRQRAYFTSSPDFVFRGIRDNKTNIDALKEMRDLGTRFLVVLNEKNEPISIVRREEIVTHLFDKLTN